MAGMQRKLYGSTNVWFGLDALRVWGDYYQSTTPHGFMGIFGLIMGVVAGIFLWRILRDRGGWICLGGGTSMFADMASFDCSYAVSGAQDLLLLPGVLVVRLKSF